MYSPHRRALVHNKAYRFLRSTLAAPLATYDLSLPEWTLLGLLFDEGNHRISELATKLNVEVPQVTATVKQLEKKGCVNVSRDPDDSRAKQIELTQKWARQMPSIEKAVQGKIDPLFSSLSPKEMAAYFKVLTTIANLTQGKTA